MKLTVYRYFLVALNTLFFQWFFFRAELVYEAKLEPLDDEDWAAGGKLTGLEPKLVYDWGVVPFSGLTPFFFPHKSYWRDLIGYGTDLDHIRITTTRSSRRSTISVKYNVVGVFYLSASIKIAYPDQLLARNIYELSRIGPVFINKHTFHLLIKEATEYDTLYACNVTSHQIGGEE
jgi:hypothetical protein